MGLRVVIGFDNKGVRTMSCLLTRVVRYTLTIVALSVFAGSVPGQVVAPSFYTTSITVQGEPEGTEFDDWAASGIPIATSDPADNVGFIDIADIQIANDNQNIFIHVTYHDANSSGTFLAFDTDQDVLTGFDIFSLGFIGSDLGYSNDFAFEQEAGVFNTNDMLTGGPFGNGGALIFPFWNINGSQKEYAIPLDIGFTNPAEPVFVNSTFNLMVYTDQGLGDISEVITYTLATAPSGPSGDFNGDEAWDCTDIDALVVAIVAGMDDAAFDMNQDGAVDRSDLTDPIDGWLAIGGQNNPAATGGNAFLEGDANLDGSVDVSDFNVWNGNKFSAVPAWCSGDFNADGIEDVSDFNIWNGNKFQNAGPATVPEPASGMLFAACLAAFAARVRRRTLSCPARLPSGRV